MDCPNGGCFGFGIELGNGFQTSDSPPSPTPTTEAFPNLGETDPASPCKAPFTSPVGNSDACYYPNPPMGNVSAE